RNNQIKIKGLTINSLVMAAPLAGVTDVVYRSILRLFNKEALIVSEMISSEALQQKKPQMILACTDEDPPVAFQISGHKPYLMLKSAIRIADQADIIDINMGCPVAKLVKGGDGCALMRTPELASEIVKTIVDNINKPVSVKFRLGWDSKSINCVEFAKLMEESKASLITVHGRTRSQMYSGMANWNKIAEVKQAVSIPVIANGDVISPETAKKCLDITGCDGVAIGRGLLGDPWLLNRVDHYLKTGENLPPPSIVERLDMTLYHCKKLVEFLGEYQGIRNSRKFFGWYIKYIQGAPKYRNILNQLETYEEVEQVINEIKENLLF
ncbi:MAG: tRNA dihydrouridine synthase DusB, partial [Cyanobacteriota bacterium]